MNFGTYYVDAVIYAVYIELLPVKCSALALYKLSNFVFVIFL